MNIKKENKDKKSGVNVESYDYVVKTEDKTIKDSRSIEYSTKNASKEETEENSSRNNSKRVEKLQAFKLEIQSMVKDCHKCFDCANAYPSKCQKIEDVDKRNICEYDFIKEGYQIVRTNLKDDEGNCKSKLESFVVSKCDNFERAQERKVTGDALKRAKAARESLYAYFYDTATYDEALLLEYELANADDDSARKIVGSHPVTSSKVADLRYKVKQKELRNRRGR